MDKQTANKKLKELRDSLSEVLDGKSYESSEDIKKQSAEAIKSARKASSALKKSFIEKRPEDVKKVLKGLFKALAFRAEDPVAAFAIMARLTGVSAGSLKGTIAGNVFLDLEQNKKSFSKSQELTSMYRSGKIISDFFIAKKVINTPVNLDELHAQHLIQSLQ